MAETEQENSISLIRHWRYTLIAVSLVTAPAWIIISCCYPYYWKGLFSGIKPTDGTTLNTSYLWFVPLGIAFSILLSYPIHRLIVVTHLKAPQKDIPPLFPTRLIQRLHTRRWMIFIGISFLMLFIIGEKIRFAYYISVIDGDIPGLSAKHTLHLRRWTLLKLTRNPNPEAIPALMKFVELNPNTFNVQGYPGGAGSESDIRHWAIYALKAFRNNEKVILFLSKIAKDDNAHGIQGDAIWVLSEIGGSVANETLKYISKNSSSKETRMDAWRLSK